jgi:DNA polymerase-3 subunit epsilon
MKRQVILDTETTGLNARAGNRIIEIGCVELIDRKLTGNNFHCYINPERDSEDGALAVHGLTTEFLRDKPKFTQIINEFIKYVHGAEVIIHNAPFDIGFLDAEFSRLGFPAFGDHIEQVVDTLVQAKELHPGKRNSLDALCTRYEISNAHRKLHGALLDAELLAEVFLAMSRGQNSFSIDIAEKVETQVIDDCPIDSQVFDVLVSTAAMNELELHDALLSGIDKEIRGQSIWRQDVDKPKLE